LILDRNLVLDGASDPFQRARCVGAVHPDRFRFAGAVTGPIRTGSNRTW
jgi:hypothetical protein